MPIRIKLMLVLNIGILIPLLTISYVSYKNSETVLKNESVKYSQDVLGIINLRVDDYISSLSTLATDLINDSTVYNYIQMDKTENDNVKIYHDEESVRDALKKKIRVKGEVQSIGVYVEDKMHCYADDSARSQSIEDIIPFGGKLYKEMLSTAYEKGGTPFWYLDSSEGKVQHIFYARAIVDRDTYKNSGMLVLMVDDNWFNSVFTGLSNEDMKNAVVLSGDKQVILSNSPNAASYKLSDEMFKQMSYDHGWISDSAQDSLISYVTVNSTKWKLATYIPYSALFSDIEYIKQSIIIGLIIAVLFLLIVSFYISYDFVSAINRLVGGMKRLQKGDENVEVNLRRKDELGFMGDTFNTMVKEITTLQKWVLREQITRKDAQIKALQSQINPHFLFNTLESINWMAQLNSVPEISETVTALATMMEANMARGSKCITLGEEMRYIDSYILILKKRFEGRLELIKEIDSSVLQIIVPRLLIQPLVENAANHGVANVRGKGVVRIAADKKGDVVNIMVEDNGAGIDPDELEMLNERLSMNDDDYFNDEQKKRKVGIGLENVNRRIKLFYGSQYGIKIESKKGSYTKVYVRIPIEKTDKTRLI
jgi:two-component system, sensor histidine kinase YesM